MILILFLILMVGVAAVFLAFYPTFCFLQRFREGKALPFCGSSSIRTEVYLSQANTGVQIFRPNRETSATLIVVPGLHPFGIHDSRFQSFAQSCADSGFVVVAPDMLEFRRFRITPNSVDLITKLVLALPDLVPSSSLQNVGLLGISFGGGPVLVAATRKTISDKVHFIVSIGGYYNLIHAMEYSVSGQHSPPGFSQPPSPHQWGRLIFALNYLDSLAPAVDLPLIQEAIRLRLNLKENEAKEVENGLSPAGKDFLTEVLIGLSPQETKRFQEMLTMTTGVATELSPESVVRDLPSHLRIYLIHGPDDELIPSAETEELVQALQKQNHKKVFSLITPSLNHVDPNQRDDWMDLIRLMFWGRKLLGEAVRSED